MHENTFKNTLYCMQSLPGFPYLHIVFVFRSFALNCMCTFQGHSLNSKRNLAYFIRFSLAAYQVMKQSV